MGLEVAVKSLQKSDLVKGQTVYGGPQKVYFPVTVPKGSSTGKIDEEEASLALFVEGFAKSSRRADETALKDNTLALSAKNLGLHDFLEEHGITCEVAYELTKADPSAIYGRMVKIMLLYLQHFAQLSPPIPSSVIESIKIRNVKSLSSFMLNLPSDTKKRYARVAARFVISCANLSAKGRLRPSLRDETKKLATMLTSCEVTYSTPELGTVHKFLRSLLLGAVKASEGETLPFEGLFQLVIAGFSHSRASKRARIGGAEDASHTAAALQYFAHVSALGEFLIEPRGFGGSTTPCNETEQDRHKGIRSMISTNLCTPAAYMRNVLLKTKRLSAAEAPRVRFARCFKHPYCGIVDNMEVSMNSENPGSLGDAIRGIQTDVQRLLNEDLMRGFRIPGDLWDRALSFPDNITARDPGYFFGNHGQSEKQMKAWAASSAVHLAQCARPILLVLFPLK